MNEQKQSQLAATLTSFIGMGIFIVLLVVGFVFLSYLFIIGGIIGLILFGIAYCRAKFFKEKTKSQKPQGRTIDQKK